MKMLPIMLALVLIAGCGTATQVTREESAAPPPAASEWVEVVRLSGQTDAKSEPFDLQGGEQKIVVEQDGETFLGDEVAGVVVAAFDVTSGLQADYTVTSGGGPHEKRMYLPAGRYYLDCGQAVVNDAPPWKCVFYELR